MDPDAVILYSILTLAYLTPTIVVLSRLHHKTGPVIVINVFFGWTIVGWVAALAMACTTQRAPVDPLPPPHQQHRTTPPATPASQQRPRVQHPPPPPPPGQ